MTNHSALIKNTFLYSLGPLLNRIISIVLIPWYSYLLTTAELGYYDLVVTTGSLVIAIGTLKISDAVYRWLIDSAGNDTKKVSAISNSLFIIVINIVLVVAAFSLIPGRYNIEQKNLVGAYIITAILFSHLQQLLRGLGYVKMYSWLSIINCLLLVVFNVVFTGLLHYKLEGVLLSVIIANIASIAVIILSVNLFKYIKIRALSKNELKAMIRYTAPLIFNAVNWWFMGGFDRYIIVTYLGIEFNGIYAVSNKFSSILVLLNSFFIPAWQDYVLTNKTGVDQKPAFSRFFNGYIVLQISLVIFLSAISKFAIMFFVDAKFADAWNYMPLLLLGSAFLALTSFLGSLFLIERNTHILFTTTLAGCLVNIALSLLLIRSIGLYGTSVGMLAGFLVTFFTRYFLLKKKMSLQINIYPVLLLGFFLILVIVAVNSTSNTAIVISILLSVVVLFVMNKKIWLNVLGYFARVIKPGWGRNV